MIRLRRAHLAREEERSLIGFARFGLGSQSPLELGRDLFCFAGFVRVPVLSFVLSYFFVYMIASVDRGYTCVPACPALPS